MKRILCLLSLSFSLFAQSETLIPLINVNVKTSVYPVMYRNAEGELEHQTQLKYLSVGGLVISQDKSQYKLVEDMWVQQVSVIGDNIEWSSQIYFEFNSKDQTEYLYLIKSENYKDENERSLLVLKKYVFGKVDYKGNVIINEDIKANFFANPETGKIEIYLQKNIDPVYGGYTP